MTDRTERATSAVHPVPATGPRPKAGKRVKRGTPAGIPRYRITVEIVVGGKVAGRAQMTCGAAEVLQSPLMTRIEDLHLAKLQRAAIENFRAKVTR